jgi:hypothetical protein
MAASKSTRRTRPRTNPTLESILRKSNVSAERQRVWNTAQASSGPLRFLAYEKLYRLNLCAEQLITALKDISGPLSTHHQAIVQKVRSETSQHLLEMMNDLEITDSMLWEKLTEGVSTGVSHRLR